jgi:hypothetical protein
VTDTRLTLRQAAAALGVSESAIRKRVERGTLRSDKGADGRRYVYVDTVTDNVADEGEDRSVTREHDALISELRAHNDTLREQLEAERQGHAWLRDTNLSCTRHVTDEQLEKAETLAGATMPDGQTLKGGYEGFWGDAPNGPTFEEWRKDKKAQLPAKCGF